MWLRWDWLALSKEEVENRWARLVSSVDVQEVRVEISQEK